MMAEMHDVVFGHESESDRRARPENAPDLPPIFRDVADHMRNVAIVRLPQLRQIVPWTVVVALAAYPVVLRVCGELELRSLLRSNEALVIVGRRIDKVPNHLFGRPLAGRARPRRFGVGYRTKPGERGFNDLQELVCDVRKSALI
jgi:hypothetical protein